MSWIGRILGIFVIIFLPWGASASADEPVSSAPVSGAFVTLEKASGGMLKYASTKADGKFIIEDLPNGTYRMSITSPASDRGPDFPHHVQGAFNGVTVVDWGERTKSKVGNGGSEIFETGVLISPELWTGGATWLDVKVTNRTVTGEFTYQD